MTTTQRQAPKKLDIQTFVDHDMHWLVAHCNYIPLSHTQLYVINVLLRTRVPNTWGTFTYLKGYISG